MGAVAGAFRPVSLTVHLNGSAGFAGRNRPAFTMRRSQIAWRSGRGLLGVVVLVKLFLRALLLGHGGALQDEVDHLVLVDRRAQLRQGVGVAAVVVPDFLLA